MKHFEFRRQCLLKRDDAELSHDSTDRTVFSKLESELLRKDDDPVVPKTVFMVLVAMFSYAIDVASSVALCYSLFDSGRWYWWVTITFLLSSLILVNLVSIRWYIHDHYEQMEYLPDVNTSHWVFRYLMHFMLVGPLIRYWELFLYGVHTCDPKEQQRHEYRLMFLQSDRDVSTLALVGSFVKSAPLLVLQTHLLMQNSFLLKLSANNAQAVNLITSIVELSFAQSAYHRARRRALPDKKNMSIYGVIVQFLSHCCVISSRVLALALFATAYRYWLIVFAIAHWLLMTSWLNFLKTSNCATSTGQPRPVEEFFFNVVFGVIYVFCFINVKDEPTRWKYATFYTIIWIENVTLVLLWYFRTDAVWWFRIPLLVGVVLTLAVGLVLLIIYYQFLHPNKVTLDAKK